MDNKNSNSTFSRRVFLFAGLYGLAALVPMYFLENTFAEQDPPRITHPEFFYGFVGVAIAWQVLFILLSRDPLKYRPLILPAILEKLTFGIAVLVLVAQGRVSAGPVIGGCIDLVLAASFAYSYLQLGRDPGRNPN